MGWTQAELGKAVGVSKSAVSQWEQGAVQNLKLGNLFAAARVLRKDVRNLVFGEDSGLRIADEQSTGKPHESSPARLVFLQNYDSLPKDIQAQLRALTSTLAKTNRGQ